MIRIIIILLMLTNSAVGQQLTVDLKKIEPQLAMQILEAQKKNDSATTAASVATSSNVINQAKEWADVGNAVGIGIAATAKSLSVEINDFVKTPVGQWAFFFLFWFIIGHKIWSVVAGIIIWIVLGSIIWHSFTIFHRPKQITLDDGRGGKRAELVYRFNSNDARATSAVAHVITFMFLSIVMILVIL